MKKCSKCGNKKDFLEFNKDRSSPDGLLYWCKRCIRQYRLDHAGMYKNVHIRYPETAKKARKAWKVRHPGRTYKNPEKIRAREKERYATDLNVKMRKILRERIRKAIKGLPIKIDKVAIVGCSLDELKRHIEAKFLEGMNWSNWTLDGWHLDHIIPLCKFDLSKEVELKTACHYTNLQPLWCKDNLAKGFYS